MGGARCGLFFFFFKEVEGRDAVEEDEGKGKEGRRAVWVVGGPSQEQEGPSGDPAERLDGSGAVRSDGVGETYRKSCTNREGISCRGRMWEAVVARGEGGGVVAKVRWEKYHTRIGRVGRYAG